MNSLYFDDSLEPHTFRLGWYKFLQTVPKIHKYDIDVDFKDIDKMDDDDIVEITNALQYLSNHMSKVLYIPEDIEIMDSRF
jgi:hypothetical protein